MRRPFYAPRIVEAEGSDRSQELATALAMTCDPEYLEALVHLKSMLDRIGGQVYIAAYRKKYNPQTGEELDDPSKPGRYETEGYAFHYEHIAKITNAPREPDRKVDDLADVQGDEGWDEQEEEVTDGADTE
jgi:hypothetical protein